MELKTITYYTEKRGVNPDIRKGVREQALAHVGIVLDDFTKVGDTYQYPIAIDRQTGETLYLKVNVSVGTTATPKAKKTKETETVELDDLFA